MERQNLLNLITLIMAIIAIIMLAALTWPCMTFTGIMSAPGY